MSKIYESDVQYCVNCMNITEHIPKMDAVKNGQRVCGNCSACNWHHDIEELLDIYNRAFNEELDDTWMTKDFGYSMEDQYKTAAHECGRYYAIVGDDVSSIDLMTNEEIIREIIEGVQNLKD